MTTKTTDLKGHTLTKQYFIRCNNPDGTSVLYTREDSEPVYANHVDMALEFAKSLSLDWAPTTYTVLRYVDGLPHGEVGSCENGDYAGAIDAW